MCSKERLLEERVEGAETLAYLIETDVELQRIASITDHLIVMLADYFKYPSSVSAITDIKRVCFPSESLKVGKTSNKWARDVSLFFLSLVSEFFNGKLARGPAVILTHVVPKSVLIRCFFWSLKYPN